MALNLGAYKLGNGGGGGGDLLAANNLSDVANAATALANIGGIPNTGNPYTALQYDGSGAAQEVNRFKGLDGIDLFNLSSRDITDANENPVFTAQDGGELNDLAAANLRRRITAGGTTGAQTIDKMAGTVNFAAAAQTLVVTNSLVTVDSIVICTIRSVGSASGGIKSVIPAAGSFTINMENAVGAETSVGFVVFN